MCLLVFEFSLSHSLSVELVLSVWNDILKDNVVCLLGNQDTTGIPLRKGEKEDINRKRKQKFDHARIRTWNLLIRSQAPYPLGHATGYEGNIVQPCLGNILTSGELCGQVTWTHIVDISAKKLTTCSTQQSTN